MYQQYRSKVVQDSIIKIPNFIRIFVRDMDETSVSDQVHKLLFFSYGSFMMLGALMWGILCLAYGYRMPSLIPFGYVVFTLFTFVLCGSSNKYSDHSCTVLVIVSICLPFAFQQAIGGIAQSGVVMLWSVLALLGSMIIQEKRLNLLWIGLFIFLTIISFMLEPAPVEGESSFNVPVLMTGLNVVLVSSLVYTLGLYFVKIQNSLRDKLAEQKNELRTVNDRVNADMHLAKGFQDVLLDLDSNSDDFYHVHEYKRNLSPVTGNFFWSGRNGETNVVVFIDNPHSGIRGSMESMLVWNLIDQAVFRLRKKTPEELINYIQKEILSRFKEEALRNEVSDLGISVIFHDTVTNEINYAIVDTCVVLSTMETCEVLRGLKTNYLGSKTSETGAMISTGKRTLGTNSKLTCINREIVRTLGIQDDDALIGDDGALRSMMVPENRIAEKNIGHLLNKTEQSADLYLVSIEF